jgi:hypothetical protein
VLSLHSQIKSIRLSASIAVCGLSIAFLAAETFHHEVARLDVSNFFYGEQSTSLSFPILNPVKAAVTIAKTTRVRALEEIAAQNTEIISQIASTEAPAQAPVASVAAAPVQVVPTVQPVQLSTPVAPLVVTATPSNNISNNIDTADLKVVSSATQKPAQIKSQKRVQHLSLVKEVKIKAAKKLAVLKSKYFQVKLNEIQNDFAMDVAAPVMAKTEAMELGDVLPINNEWTPSLALSETNFLEELDMPADAIQSATPATLVASASLPVLSADESIELAELMDAVEIKMPAQLQYAAETNLNTLGALANEVAAKTEALPEELPSQMTTQVANANEIKQIPALAAMEAAETENLPTVKETSIVHILSGADKAADSLVADSSATAAAKVSVANKAIEATQEARLNTIQGEIALDISSKKVKGHFEVGLYNKIDESGNPVGYPVAQAIIPKGQKRFSLEVPTNEDLNALHMYAQYIPAQGQGEPVWYGYSGALSTKKPVTIQAPLAQLAKADEVTTRDSASEKQEAVQVPKSRKSNGIAIASLSDARAEEASINGQVAAMFSNPEQPIFLDGVKVSVRGTKLSTTTDAQGQFKLSLPMNSGAVVLEFARSGFYASTYTAPANPDEQIKIELASKEAIEKLATSLGIRQLSSKAVYVVKAVKDGHAQAGVAMSISLKGDGPYYFDSNGFPTRDRTLQSTSFDGRAIFFNVDAGVTTLSMRALDGQEMAPIALSSVEGGELVARQLEIADAELNVRLYDPLKDARGNLVPLKGAKVRIKGSEGWAQTGADGSVVLPYHLYIKNAQMILEMEHDGYYDHRYTIFVNEKTTKDLYAISKKFVNGIANATDNVLDPYTAIVMGSVGTGKNLRIDTLSDHSEANATKDYYFDAKKTLQAHHSGTNPNYGTFLLMNVPAGKALLYGYDNNAKLKYADVLYAEPSTINVLVAE